MIFDDNNCETFPALNKKIISDNLKSVFPMLKLHSEHDSDQLYRGTFIFQTETNKEWSSQLMGQQRLNWLSLTFIESAILKIIDLKLIIISSRQRNFANILW